MLSQKFNDMHANIMNPVEMLENKYSFIIFTDASTSPTQKVAVGAFLHLTPVQIHVFSTYSSENLYAKLLTLVRYSEYRSKKSTWSEIKSVIDALNLLPTDLKFNPKVAIYTDCQSLCDLMGNRKEKLQKNNFITKSGNTLQNADLYKELFAITKTFQVHVFKTKGHRSYINCVKIQEKIFLHSR